MPLHVGNIPHPTRSLGGTVLGSSARLTRTGHPG